MSGRGRVHSVLVKLIGDELIRLTEGERAARLEHESRETVAERSREIGRLRASLRALEVRGPAELIREMFASLSHEERGELLDRLADDHRRGVYARARA